VLLDFVCLGLIWVVSGDGGIRVPLLSPPLELLLPEEMEWPDTPLYDLVSPLENLEDLEAPIEEFITERSAVRTDSIIELSPVKIEDAK
jgi:hypothetical protein